MAVLSTIFRKHAVFPHKQVFRRRASAEERGKSVDLRSVPCSCCVHMKEGRQPGEVIVCVVFVCPPRSTRPPGEVVARVQTRG